MMTPQTPVARAVSTYRAQFGTEPEMLFRAPGRVNLIGEHTDYNDGFVLPCAIDRETVVAVGGRRDNDLIAIACDLGNQRDQFSLLQPVVHSDADWANYVRGMAKALIDDGCHPRGVQMAIASNVPLGSGLSSSASLEVAVGTALAAMWSADITPTHLAKLAQKAENDFVGCACGIMDQLIATRAQDGHALIIDCRSLDCVPVKVPDGVSIIIAHSGHRHSHAGGEYNDRRAQCEAAARHYGVTALRDLSVAALVENQASLDDVVFRRARHVVTENERTRAAATALTQSDLESLGQLMAQSHASMRDDFEITIPAIDDLASIMAAPLGGQGGARMTGGGFGGCVVAIAPDAFVRAVVDAVAANYRTPSGEAAEIFVCHPSGGAGRL